MPAENPHYPTTFATTRWTLVLAAGDARSPSRSEALEELCRLYWYPLYAFIRRRGWDPHTAQDLTQGFFARLLEPNRLAHVQREGGRFRAYLLTSVRHYLANEHERASAQKRGGSCFMLSLHETDAEERYLREPFHEASPDRLFEQQWALTLMEQALKRLADEQTTADHAHRFALLRPFLSRDPTDGEYPEIAEHLGINPGTIAVQVHRLRNRYRQLVRAAVADTVASPLEIEAEMRHLRDALALR